MEVIFFFYRWEGENLGWLAIRTYKRCEGGGGWSAAQNLAAHIDLPLIKLPRVEIHLVLRSGLSTLTSTDPKPLPPAFQFGGGDTTAYHSYRKFLRCGDWRGEMLLYKRLPHDENDNTFIVVGRNVSGLIRHMPSV